MNLPKLENIPDNKLEIRVETKAKSSVLGLYERLNTIWRRVFLQNYLYQFPKHFLFAFLIVLGIVLLYRFNLLSVQSSPVFAIYPMILLSAIISIGIGFWIFYRQSPNLQEIAILVDHRFDLAERVTTALYLSEESKKNHSVQVQLSENKMSADSIHMLVISDAISKLNSLEVKKLFPIFVPRNWIWIPGLFILAFLGNRFLGKQFSFGSQDKDHSNEIVKDDKEKEKSNDSRKFDFMKKREISSPEVAKLEAEINALLEEIKNTSPQDRDKVREQIEKLGQKTRELRELKNSQDSDLRKLQDQLSKLKSVGGDNSSETDAVKEFEEMLRKNDLASARKQLEKLHEELKKNKPNKQEAEQLKRELKDLQDQLEKLSRRKEEIEKLQKLIEEAKKEKRDSQTLERELDNLKKDLEKTKKLEDLAKKLGELSESLDQNQLEKTLGQLDDLSEDIKGIIDQMREIEDLEGELDRLEELKESLLKQFRVLGGEEGDDIDGDGEKNEDIEDIIAKRSKKNNGGYGAGERDLKENDTNSKEERTRGNFDPKGQKRSIGLTNGPGFVKKSTQELKEELRQAAQEAPKAMDTQRLRKADQNTVKEYFESLEKNLKTK